MRDMGKICVRLAVIGMVAVGASACSSVPDWVDPTNWVGGNDGPPPEMTDNSTGESPDLASIPDKPEPTTTEAQRQQVASSLAADRADAKYSADALRAGTEPVTAPPPPAPSPEPKVAQNTEPPPAPPPAAAPAPEAQPEAATSDTGDGDIDTRTGEVSTQPAPAPSTAQAPASAPAPVQMASAETPPPPAPPPQTGMPTEAQINPSDAALGFKPSTAPPLDASIAQFVPRPILNRYNQTAPSPSVTDQRIAEASSVPAHRRGKAMGGPEMTGAVVANLETLQSLPENTPPSVYANAQGLPPTAVVFFPGDGTLLNSEARARVRAAVAEFKQRGGTGFVRVVGHAASRTANMPVEKHLEVIFDKSQERANAVAKEIIKDGVPADRVLVEAVGDSQPVYYESMPKGEDGNRRAEIFLQS